MADIILLMPPALYRGKRSYTRRALRNVKNVACVGYATTQLRPYTKNTLILIMGISLFPIALSLFPFRTMQRQKKQ